MRRATRHHLAPILAALAALLALACGSSSALAATGGAQWKLTSVPAPTIFTPGNGTGDDQYTIRVVNTGGAATDGSPIVVTDTLPSAITLHAGGVSGVVDHLGIDGGSTEPLTCSTGSPLTCTSPATAVEPDADLYITVRVDVEPVEAESITNTVTVSGGGAPAASLSNQTTVGDALTGFGFLTGAEGFTAAAESAGGATATQAGSHPYAFTTDLNFDREVNEKGEPITAGDVRDVHVAVPPGLIGNPTIVPTCTQAQFQTETTEADGETSFEDCPNASAIGTAAITFDPLKPDTVPVFSLEPPPGYPAAFGFNVDGTAVLLTPHIREDGSYGLTVDSMNTAQSVLVFEAKIAIWGVPYESSHDGERGSCLNGNDPDDPLGSCPGNGTPKAYLTLPTSCNGPITTTVTADSWQNPASYLPDGEPDLSNPNWDVSSSTSQNSEGVPLGLEGCNRVPFTPTVAARPTTDAAGSSSGLDFDMDFTNEGLTNPNGVAQSDLKKAVVTLPEGFTVNPSAGAGLGACSLAEYEQESLHSEAAAGCPEDAKLGDVEIESPLVEGKIEGSVYIARQEENPFHTLLAIYMVARNSHLGVFIKSAGKVEANEVTGQITTTFENLPQLPFSHFQLSFHQGNTSPLVSPSTCGTYTAEAALTPWSEPSRVLYNDSSFQITTGIGGGACPSGGVPPFAPQVVAGTEDDSAGSYSPLYLRISRNDGEQEITGFSTQLPAGLTANLSGIPFCSEAQIAAARAKTGVQEEAEPACPAGSEIGHTIAEAGVGSVLAQTPGKLYMAGPFEGAPFSIVSITSADVGPFDLGTVVVHLPLNINPETAAVTIPSGPADQIPHIIKGIVIHVRAIRVYVNRSEFTINPTSCSAMSIGATVIGSGANYANPTDANPVAVTNRFQAANCANLKFAPKFTASTSGKTSKADGASLSVKLTYPAGALGQDANIHQVKVDLPKQLPSELKTLQKACTAAQFNANPANCPAASVVGQAKAITPILPVPLEGPAYFVSHGNEAFPSLIMVLQGDGVRIDLVGSTNISKAGITSSTFKAVPDQPVTSFELTLPEGKYSALAANLPESEHGNMCGQKLAMPTAFVGQNGAEIHTSTPIAVSGCAKVKALTRAQKLQKALKACKRDRSKARKAKCEKTARRQYGPVKIKKKTKKGKQ